MTQNKQSISPLRQRMIEDMQIRKLAPKTHTAYLRAVKNFTRFLGRCPDRANAEDLRRYQLHLVSSGISRPSLNAQVTALRFFFDATVGRAQVTSKMRFVRSYESEQRYPQIPIAPCRRTRWRSSPAVSSLEACQTPALTASARSVHCLR